MPVPLFPQKTKKLLERGVRDGVFPGAVLLVAKMGKILFHLKVGHRCTSPEDLPMKKETIFDLASLTKPLATTLGMMKLVDSGKIGLDQPIKEIISATPLRDKKELTPRLLLNHSAGFSDWKPFYLDLVKEGVKDRKRAVREFIIDLPLIYAPATKSIYSDLGFMILEWLIEEASGMKMQPFLDHNFYRPLSLERTFLFSDSVTPPVKKEVFAATEDCPWRKRVLQGEVHDENAYALGGHSGHAGLFGTATEVYQIVNLLGKHFFGKKTEYLKRETVKEFFTRADIVKGNSWALGWDTPSPDNSSSGRYFSPLSVGHLGYTGTSVWVDLVQDVTVLFLSNRVHPARDNVKIRVFRPELHDTIMEEIDGIS